MPKSLQVDRDHMSNVSETQEKTKAEENKIFKFISVSDHFIGMGKHICRRWTDHREVTCLNWAL